MPTHPPAKPDRVKARADMEARQKTRAEAVAASRAKARAEMAVRHQPLTPA